MKFHYHGSNPIDRHLSVSRPVVIKEKCAHFLFIETHLSHSSSPAVVPTGQQQSRLYVPKPGPRRRVYTAKGLARKSNRNHRCGNGARFTGERGPRRAKTLNDSN